MYLKQLIELLEREDPNRVLPIGFYYPHSFRGNYYDLAFVLRPNVTVGECLATAKSAVGSRYEGYKGGEYKMDEYSDVWFAEVGDSTYADRAGPLLLSYMLGKKPKIMSSYDREIIYEEDV
jgi:hypothetical protein